MVRPAQPVASPADEPSSESPTAWYVRPEAAAWGALAVAVGFGLTTPNPLLAAGALAVLPVLILLLWRRGEVPILLFAATYQWFQVSAKVFHANSLGLPVTYMSTTPTVERAIWMGLIAVMTLAVGMRLALRGLPSRGGEMAEEASQITVRRAFGFYLLCTVLGGVVEGAAFVVPGVRQLVMALATAKWTGFFVLGCVVLFRRQGYLLLVGATLFEFIQGIGFFSGFKTVIFVFALATLTVFHRLNTRTLSWGLAGLAGLIVLGSAWTEIKTEFRGFLNQGSGMQETVVSRGEAFDELADLFGGVTWDDIVDSINPLLSRVAYVDYFALTMDYVPEAVPHQEGRVWLGAVQNLVPRLFYPSKPVLRSDSDHTNEYTGLSVAGGDKGTSISLGYVADSYIDFGPVGMYGVILAVGFLWGAMYRYFVARSESALIGFGLAMAALLLAYQYEIAAIKLLAGVVVKFVVLAVALRYLEGRAITWLGLRETAGPEVDDAPARGVRGGRPAYA